MMDINESLYSAEKIQEIIFHGSLLLACFLAIILFLVWRAYENKKRSNISLFVKNKEIEGQNKQIKLAQEKILKQHESLKIAQRSIEKINEDLKRKNIELTEAKEKAESASVAKQNFLSNMSHEIRTPLNAIIGMSEVLINENPQKEQMDELNAIKFSGEHLLALVNDILDLTKIEEGKIVIENIRFNLDQLIQSIKSTFTLVAQDKGLILNFSLDKNIPSNLMGDPVRLAQILNNLISNALKFTEKGEINVFIRLINKSKDTVQVHFSVEDTGIGISLEEQKLIFERFEQAKTDTTRNFGGSGLGLTITKHLLELQDSEIQMESQPGIGTKFYFDLAFNYSEVPHPGKHPETYTDMKYLINDLRVLLVEDNEINLKVAQKILTKLGIKVVSASNGKEALSAFQNGDFEIVLMDLHMPVMDGFEATRQISELCRKQGKYVPIIALTADVMPDTRTRIEELEMAGYVIKPINPVDLKNKLIDAVIANSKP